MITPGIRFLSNRQEYISIFKNGVTWVEKSTNTLLSLEMGINRGKQRFYDQKKKKIFLIRTPVVFYSFPIHQTLSLTALLVPGVSSRRGKTAEKSNASREIFFCD